MADENNGGAKPAVPKACERLEAAYQALRADPRQENYLALFEALEADLKVGAGAYVRIETEEDATALREKGAIKWQGLETSKGRMLPLFTSAGEAMRKPAAANVLLALGAFFKLLAEHKEIVGFVVNPLDGKMGVPLDRANLETVVRRAQGGGAEGIRLDPRLMSAACLELFKIAVGVPTPVYEFQQEIQTLGGLNAVMNPIQAKWQKAVADGSFKPASPDEYVKTIVKDAMTTAFVAGALVKKGPEMVKSANVDACLERVPYLKDDLGQNTDEYLILLCDALRYHLKAKDDKVIWVTLANNIGLVVYGAVCFGFGWGLAKCCESEGPEALAALKVRQKAALEAMKAAEAEARRKAEEEAAKAASATKA